MNKDNAINGQEITGKKSTNDDLYDQVTELLKEANEDGNDNPHDAIMFFAANKSGDLPLGPGGVPPMHTRGVVAGNMSTLLSLLVQSMQDNEEFAEVVFQAVHHYKLRQQRNPIEDLLDTFESIMHRRQPRKTWAERLEEMKKRQAEMKSKQK